jgi:hypothetical protein
MRPSAFDHKKIESIFNRYCIVYNRDKFYEFSYNVQKVISNFGFYKIHAKIGHFKLTVNTLLFPLPNIFANLNGEAGSSGNCYFVNFNGNSICLKSIPYNGE